MNGLDTSNWSSTEIEKAFNQELNKLIEKEILKMSDFSYSFISRMPLTVGNWGMSLAEGTPRKYLRSDFIPTKIIYNGTTTVCYFKDGSKEMVHCAEDEQFVKEVGVMSCIMKKLFDSRNEFKRLVNSGYVQPQPLLSKETIKKLKPKKTEQMPTENEIYEAISKATKTR
jgi:hypothetical protein